MERVVCWPRIRKSICSEGELLCYRDDEPDGPVYESWQTSPYRVIGLSAAFPSSMNHHSY